MCHLDFISALDITLEGYLLAQYEERANRTNTVRLKKKLTEKQISEIRMAYTERSMGLEVASMVPSLCFCVLFHVFLDH